MSLGASRIQAISHRRRVSAEERKRVQQPTSCSSRPNRQIVAAFSPGRAVLYEG
jgi:hypothetical protein